MKTVQEVIAYFENLYNSGAVYLWGANGQIITWELCERLYKSYGSKTYDWEYYENKFKEGKGKIGADCSGAFYPMSGSDKTAQGYYTACTDKGVISKIDRNKPCMVFKGTASNKINHVGFYLGNGYVIEMKSSRDNCVKSPLDGHGWKFYGIPSWIDYGRSGSDNDATMYTLGVDVSSIQKTIDFNAVRNAGYKFAILRTILKKGTMDTMFSENFSKATQAGVKVGVYILSYALTEMEAITSAKKIMATLNGNKVPIFLDLESDGHQLESIGKAGIANVAKAFIQACKQSGYPVYIYCNLDWYKNVIDASLKPYAVWIARYGKNDGKYNPGYKPNVGEKIWQFTSKGSVPGINGNVDMDACYDMAIFDAGQNATPKPSYNMQAINALGKITANSLHIRKEPSASSQSLGYYHKDEIVPLTALVDNGWYKTDKGFISGKYVTVL